MTAEGLYIPKEQDSKGINQFRPISLLNVEGKIVFSIMASRLTKYLTENGYINSSVKKGGIPGVSGCLEHATMIWEAIQRVKSKKLNLNVVLLDLANSYGSVPHEMIQLALRMYHVPEVIQVMLDDYFSGFRMRFSTNGYTTNWINVEVGIAMGCTISPILFVMAMEIIFKAAEGSAGPANLGGGCSMPPLKAFMDGTTIICSKEDETRRMLTHLDVLMSWCRMEFKPKKSRSLSIRCREGSPAPQQGQWTNWDTAIQRSLTWNDIWHVAPLRISFLIRTVYDLLPSNANLVRWRKKDDPTCPLCQGRQTTEHVLSSCKVALSQGRYTWRHNRVLQELASVLSGAKGKIHPSSTSSTVFTTEDGVKKWQGGSITINTHRKGLLDGCDDWVVSADLPEWERHPDVIRKTALRPDIVIHPAPTQQIIMVKLTVPYESRMEKDHAFEEGKYLDLTKELKKDGYEARVMPVGIGARGFVGSSAYGLLSKLSICGNKRTKALRPLAETAENSSRWIWNRRNERLLH
ncbi:reverse transcriptase [Plakobranchus ocellatus]|uniref:Reverse transcriptase n=1 Tax=Plakobranchus ocellatus TaxID=259542 RepID=A0AAV3Z1P6_9GAST|nr:reverse transcriptase [Plakobranchus ocellatus]